MFVLVFNKHKVKMKYFIIILALFIGCTEKITEVQPEQFNISAVYNWAEGFSQDSLFIQANDSFYLSHVIYYNVFGEHYSRFDTTISKNTKFRTSPNQIVLTRIDIYYRHEEENTIYSIWPQGAK